VTAVLLCRRAEQLGGAMTINHDQPTLAAPDGKVQEEWKPGDPLEPPEQQLLHHAEAGTRLDLAGDGPVDHQAMDGWDAARTVRAAVMRHLLVEPEWSLHSKGVRLRGARISGRLDLESTEVRCPLLLEDCYFDSPELLTLDCATASRIVLARCRVAGGLAAGLLVVTKELDLSGSAFEGAVQLLGADIAGQLNCQGAQLTGKDSDGNALVGHGMTVGGHVFLDDGFTAAGAVSIAAARIGGSLWLSLNPPRLRALYGVLPGQEPFGTRRAVHLEGERCQRQKWASYQANERLHRRNRWIQAQSSRIVGSSRRSRSGSAKKSSSTILPLRTVKAPIEKGWPWRKPTTPATPLISAGRMSRSGQA
jgi:hypothetical protein